ncbi:hypothetical protein D9M68_530950 [compost metagenome]
MVTINQQAQRIPFIQKKVYSGFKIIIIPPFKGFTDLHEIGIRQAVGDPVDIQTVIVPITPVKIIPESIQIRCPVIEINTRIGSYISSHCSRCT